MKRWSSDVGENVEEGLTTELSLYSHHTSHILGAGAGANQHAL